MKTTSSLSQTTALKFAWLGGHCWTDIREVATFSKGCVTTPSAFADVVLTWFIIRLLYDLQLAMICLPLQGAKLFFNLFELLKEKG